LVKLKDAENAIELAVIESAKHPFGVIDFNL
jgi:hypothetical protein